MAVVISFEIYLLSIMRAGTTDNLSLYFVDRASCNDSW